MRTAVFVARGYCGGLDVNHSGIHDLTLDLHHLLIVPCRGPLPDRVSVRRAELRREEGEGREVRKAEGVCRRNGQ